MKVRETFQGDMLTLLSVTTRLLATPVPPEATSTVRTALWEERARWRAKVDQTTKDLADNAGQLAFAYGGARIPELAVRYSGTTRMVWISDRDEDAKLHGLKAITQHCHALLFDSPLHTLQRTRSWRELERLLDELETPDVPNGE
ncbi:hypothetical protein GCM10009577_37210 [Streptomyces javensis]